LHEEFIVKPDWNRKFLLGVLIFLLLLSLIIVIYRRTAGTGYFAKPHGRESFAMNTLVRVLLYSAKNADDAERVLDGAFDLIDSMDGRFSMYRASSDVSLINAGAGERSVRVSRDVFDVAAEAKSLAKLTDGAFDPTVGPLSLLWRVSGKGESRGALPGVSEIKNALSLVDYGKLVLIQPDEVFLEKRGMALDLGGIAKGYASEAVGDYLRSNDIKSALIDLGGNILVVGGRPDGTPWRIGIQHPFRPRGESICSVAVSDESVITAGVYERFIEAEGEKFTHIFDTRTGYPLKGNLLSATVVTKHPSAGDALSTAFMVMGAKKAAELLSEMDDVDAVFISANSDGEVNVTATRGLEGRLELSPKLSPRLRWIDP
jgi:thiamine biosynthesis lipoprotein